MMVTPDFNSREWAGSSANSELTHIYFCVLIGVHDSQVENFPMMYSYHIQLTSYLISELIFRINLVVSISILGRAITCPSKKKKKKKIQIKYYKTFNFRFLIFADI